MICHPQPSTDPPQRGEVLVLVLTVINNSEDDGGTLGERHGGLLTTYTATIRAK